MVTDGYAPHVTPADPDRWIWLITDNGDTWPETRTPADGLPSGHHRRPLIRLSHETERTHT